MVEKHPFTFRIEADLLQTSRYRWMVCEGSQIHVRSPHSYATRQEAEKKLLRPCRGARITGGTDNDQGPWVAR